MVLGVFSVGFAFLLQGFVNSENDVKSRTKLTLGLLTPKYDLLGYERVASAATIAVEQAKKDGFVQDMDIR